MWVLKLVDKEMVGVGKLLAMCLPIISFIFIIKSLGSMKISKVQFSSECMKIYDFCTALVFYCD